MSTVSQVGIAFFSLALVFIVVRGIREARPKRRVVSDALAAVAGMFLCLVDVAAWSFVIAAGCVVGIVAVLIVGRRPGEPEVAGRSSPKA